MRLHDFLDSWAERQPDSALAAQGDRRLTYHQARLATNRLTQAFVVPAL